MKNIYELSLEEKSKYRKEFNKTPFFKNIQGTRIPLFLIFIIMLMWMLIILPSLEEAFPTMRFWEEMYSISLDLFVIDVTVFGLIEIYQNICFMRWMKIKHKIDS